jgi:hypothetical protein
LALLGSQLRPQYLIMKDLMLAAAHLLASAHVGRKDRGCTSILLASALKDTGVVKTAKEKSIFSTFDQ